MKILGVDPGLATLGWCMLEPSPTGQPLARYGAVCTPAHEAIPRRLHTIYGELKDLIEIHRPGVLALETVFITHSAKTLAQVGQARGVVLLLAGQYGLEAFEYAPRQIKMALTGFGGADKRQIQQVVQRMLGLPSIPQPDDAADAVAVALCHAQFSHHAGKMAATV